MRFAAAIQLVIAVVTIGVFCLVSYARGRHDAAAYYHTIGWATGISICNVSPDFCKRSRAEADAILEEARRNY